jgi:hypothetical protein
MTIVNFATQEYKRGQQRLANSLNGQKKLMLDNYEAIGSPSHSISPYEFKVHSIEAAFEYDDIVLWCDSSLWRVGDLAKIENIIKADGYFMEEAGHWVRDWCKPETQQYFNLTPEELRTFNMFSAGLLGLDRTNEMAASWFVKWKISAIHGHFKGSYTNHRHDMTCGSIIAQRMGFKYQRGGSHMAYIGEGYSKPEKDVVFYLQGI